MDTSARRLSSAARRHDGVPPLAPSPLPPWAAWSGVGRCLVASTVMLAQHRIWQPREHVGRAIRFADGSVGRVYRETRVDRQPPSDPCVLVVGFRLRWVRGPGHQAFEVESLLNTPLFVGFPGLVSKLWLAHDDRSLYRGLYEWDGPHLADTYARSMWRVLALVSEPGSIDFRVLSGLRRDDLLADPVRALAAAPVTPGSWWRVVGSSPGLSRERGLRRRAARAR